MKTITPLPCPFCGSSPRKCNEWGDERNGYADTVVYQCTGCGVQIGATGDTSKPGYADNSKIEEQALAKWNRRIES